MKYLQEVIKKWIMSTFDTDTFTSTEERAKRLLEEAIELAQSVGISETDAIKQVFTTYARPAGEPNQEIGGLGVCIFALCENLELDFYEELQREITRIHTPQVIEKARARWTEKARNGTGIRTVRNGTAEPGEIGS